MSCTHLKRALRSCRFRRVSIVEASLSSTYKRGVIEIAIRYNPKGLWSHLRSHLHPGVLRISVTAASILIEEERELDERFF